MTFVPEPPDVAKPRSEQPHFEIQVGDGRGLLLLRPRTFFGWLRIDELQLAIPEVHFPLDITGGMAQFQRQRCPVLAATISVERGGLVVSVLAPAGWRLPELEGLHLSSVSMTEKAASLRWARPSETATASAATASAATASAATTATPSAAGRAPQRSVRGVVDELAA